MKRISTFDVAPTNNADEFEDLCCDLWAAEWDAPMTKKHGRKGQAQLGVDVYGIPCGRQRYYGVQSKCRSFSLGSRLTEKDIINEVAEARKFRPALEHLIIATTSPSDAKLEALARQITEEHSATGLFGVSVYGWGDILRLMDNHERLARKYFPNQFGEDSLKKKQEALLVAQNPTTLEAKDLRKMSFLGDSEPYLTLDVQNTSDLAANNVRLSVLLPVKPGKKQSEVAEFTPSKCVNINAIPNYSIPKKTKQSIPFAPESEAQAKLSGDYSSYRLVGVGLHPNIPNELCNEIRDLYPSIHLPVINLQAQGFGILLEWKSIFEESKSMCFGAFLYLWDEENDMLQAQELS